MSGMGIVNERVLTSPIPIIDGKITIEIPDWHIRIIAPVKQVKGRGVKDADDLKLLTKKHTLVIRLMTDCGWDSYSAKQIKTLVEAHFKKVGQSVDVNHYNRTISELFRRKLILMIKGNPPKYSLNFTEAQEAVRTLRFPVGI